MSNHSPNPYQAPTTIGGAWIDSTTGEPNPLLDGRLATAGLGLKMIHWGIVSLLISLICLIPMGIVMAMFESQLWIERFVQVAYVGVSLLGLGFIHLGLFLCLTVPRGYGLRSFVVATVISIALYWGASAITTINPPPSQVMNYLAFLFVIASFLAFLYRLSRAIDRDDLTRRCRNVFILGSIVLLFGISSSMFSISATQVSGLWFVWPIVILLGGLLFVVSYANLVNALANAIRRPRMRTQSESIQ